jgi:hypothetical protein
VLLNVQTALGVDSFVLPTSFLGLWKGGPEYNIIGPFAPNSFEFGISQAPNGDYLFEDNLLYDDVMIGYQRFYVEGSGATAGTLWYCGNLSHFANADEITSTNSFKPYTFPKSTDLSVTFCLDSDSPVVMNPFNPFKKDCTHCDCANWTLAYEPTTDTLQLQMTMSGFSTVGSYHLWAELSRIGAAPVITDNDVAGHGSNFSCDFSEGGRDNNPVIFPDNNHLKARLISVEESKNSLEGHRVPPKGGCPFMAKQMLRPAPETPSSVEKPSAPTSYQHCYTLNSQADYKLQWTLDVENSLLSLAVSAPVKNNSWVAIGFRPDSRDFSVQANREGTGHHMNFGMQGADIVAGSTSGSVRFLYAAAYTGAPVPSDSLVVYNESVSYVDGRLTLSFTRDLVGGYAHANYGNAASILDETADILWGIGADVPDSPVKGGECDYHYNTRGLRVIDWQHPEIAMADAWKCGSS